MYDDAEIHQMLAEFERTLREESAPLQDNEPGPVDHVVEAIRAIKLVTAPTDVSPVVKALGSLAILPRVVGAVDALTLEVRKAISIWENMKPPDMSQTHSKMDELAKVGREIASALRAEKLITFDKNGEPTGLKPKAMN